MASKSKQKGNRFESQIVNWHKERGVQAEKVPLSGACKGSYSSDIMINGYAIEAKKRGSGTGFKSLYDWFAQDNADILVVGADRKPPIYCLTQETWEAIIKQLGWIK